MKTIRLRAAKERSLLRRHPWVFESSIERGKADLGETVRVEGHDGRFLAWAAYSPESKIRLRAWSFDEQDRIDAAFMQGRVARAVALRDRLALPSDGVRLVHGEADGLPGLVVDRYADTLCAQFLSAGVERWKGVLTDVLVKASGAARLYERSDTSSRTLEGLEPQTGWRHGSGSTELTIREHDWQLTLDVAEGHKTGYYLDQRDNRRLFAEAVGRFASRRVLNCYAYTGGFSIAALAGGANEVGGVEFRASNVDSARRESLAKAVAIACGDAAAMARAVGASAGQAIELSTVFEGPPRPMMELQMARVAAASDVPTPINPGEFVVAATVTARWPLQYGASTPARCQ